MESGEVRQAWEQVNGRPCRPEEVECAAARGCSEKIRRLRCGHGARPGLRYWGGNGGYDRARSAAADDLPVLTESLVGLGDHTAGDLKLSGQQATCWEPAADRQPAVADRPAKLGGQPVRKRASRGLWPDRAAEVRGVAFGPLVCARFGPVHRSIVTATLRHVPKSPEMGPFIGGLLLGGFGMVLVGGSVAVSEVLIRYLAAAVFLVLMSRVAGVQVLHPRGSEWLWLAGIAATGLVLFNVAIVRGASHAERAAMAVAVACVPVLIGLPGPLLDRQRPSQQVVLAAVVVTIGGVIVEGTGRIDASGIGWAIVALLCEAAFTLLAIPVSRRQGAWGVSLHTVWIASAMLLALGIFVEGAQAAVRLRTDHWAAIGYLAVMVTAVAFVCWYSSVAIIGAPRAGLLTGIAPPALPSPAQ